jgi:uncharacterized membrane protein YfcA
MKTYIGLMIVAAVGILCGWLVGSHAPFKWMELLRFLGLCLAWLPGALIVTTVIPMAFRTRQGKEETQ